MQDRPEPVSPANAVRRRKRAVAPLLDWAVARIATLRRTTDQKERDVALEEAELLAIIFSRSHNGLERTLAALRDFINWKDGHRRCTPKVATLAKKAGISKSNCHAALRILEDENIVAKPQPERGRFGRQGPCVYKLADGSLLAHIRQLIAVGITIHCDVAICATVLRKYSAKIGCAEFSVADLTVETGLTKDTVRAGMIALCREGLIVCSGPGLFTFSNQVWPRLPSYSGPLWLKKGTSKTSQNKQKTAVHKRPIQNTETSADKPGSWNSDRAKSWNSDKTGSIYKDKPPEVIEPRDDNGIESSSITSVSGLGSKSESSRRSRTRDADDDDEVAVAAVAWPSGPRLRLNFDEFQKFVELHRQEASRGKISWRDAARAIMVEAARDALGEKQLRRRELVDEILRDWRMIWPPHGEPFYRVFELVWLKAAWYLDRRVAGGVRPPINSWKCFNGTIHDRVRQLHVDCKANASAEPVESSQPDIPDIFEGIFGTGVAPAAELFIDRAPAVATATFVRDKLPDNEFDFLTASANGVVAEFQLANWRNACLVLEALVRDAERAGLSQPRHFVFSEIKKTADSARDIGVRFTGWAGFKPAVKQAIERAKP